MHNRRGVFVWKGVVLDIHAKLRSLRTSSLIVTIFAAALVITGLTQLTFGAIAVSDEYDRIERLEEQIRPRIYYGYEAEYAARQAEYNRSSSAFFLSGRFLADADEFSWTDKSALTFLALLASAFGFMISAMAWVYRAHANIAEAGVRPKFPPGKAVAAYLLPIANLFVPFEAMRELYNRSHGENEDFAHSPVDDVTAWWTAMLVGLLILSAMLAKLFVDAATALVIMTPLWMEYVIIAFSVVLLLGAAYLFSALTRKITRAQEEWLHEIAETAEDLPDPPRMTVTVR